MAASSSVKSTPTLTPAQKGTPTIQLSMIRLSGCETDWRSRNRMRWILQIVRSSLDRPRLGTGRTVLAAFAALTVIDTALVLAVEHLPAPVALTGGERVLVTLWPVLAMLLLVPAALFAVGAWSTARLHRRGAAPLFAWFSAAMTMQVPIEMLGQIADPENYVIEVRDRGPGIPADERALVLEPYARGSTAADRPGRGLGLHVARRLAEGHGRALELENRDDGPGTLIGCDCGGRDDDAGRRRDTRHDGASRRGPSGAGSRSGVRARARARP